MQDSVKAPPAWENVTPNISLALPANAMLDACSLMTAVMIIVMPVLLQTDAVTPLAATPNAVMTDVAALVESVLTAKPVPRVNAPARPNVKAKPVATMVAAAYVVSALLEVRVTTTTAPKTSLLAPVAGTRINPVPREANAS